MGLRLSKQDQWFYWVLSQEKMRFCEVKSICRNFKGQVILADLWIFKNHSTWFPANSKDSASKKDVANFWVPKKAIVVSGDLKNAKQIPDLK